MSSKNDYRSSVLAVVVSFSGQDNMLTIPRAFIDMCKGDRDTALWLNQMIYWQSRATLPDDWVAKSYAEWNDELTLSQHLVTKAAAIFVDLGILETEVKRFNGSPTVHYRLNKEALTQWIVNYYTSSDNENFNNGKSNSLIMESEPDQQSITETTTKTTTKRKPDLIFEIVCKYSFGKHYTQIGHSRKHANRVVKAIKEAGITPEQLEDGYIFYANSNKNSIPMTAPSAILDKVQKAIDAKANTVTDDSYQSDPRRTPLHDAYVAAFSVSENALGGVLSMDHDIIVENLKSRLSDPVVADKIRGILGNDWGVT